MEDDPWYEAYDQFMHAQEERDMKVSDVYSSESKSLKAEDLQGKARELTISGYEIVEFTNDGKTTSKIVLGFAGAKKGLVLNVINSTRVTGNLGTDDMEEWSGKKITIYPTTTDFNGSVVPCIRVKEEMPEAVTADFDDDIPF